MDVKKIKIGYVPAVPFFLNYSGGEVGLVHPYNVLKKRGLDISLIDIFNKNLKYDILHFFGLHYGHYRIISMAKAAGIKIILSPISYATKKQFVGSLFHRINKYIKIPTTQHLHREIILLSDKVIPNSYAEKIWLEKYFNLKLNNYTIAYNAISKNFFEDIRYEFTETYGINDFILCVGKIEPRKHQLELAKLIQKTNYKIVFIGAPVLDAIKYFEEFIDIVNKSENIYHFMPFEQESNLFKSAYICSKIHILLGDNETPGIANLEAIVAGKNIVVNDCKPVREYFTINAFYCNNQSNSSILNAIDLAISSPINKDFIKECELKYSWENMADIFQTVYKDVIEDKR